MTDDALDDIDFAILHEVRDLADLVDPVPTELVDKVKFALTVQALDAELAELMASPLVQVRSQDVALAQSITFTSSTLSLMISVSEERDGTIRLDGWVTQGGAQIELHVDPAPFGILAVPPQRVVEAEATGRFVIDGLTHGRFVFVVRQHPERPSERPVVTPAMEL